MKRIITGVALILSSMTFAQAPNLMSYQAVVYDGSNNLVTSSPVGMQISILQGSVTGTAVYEETHTPTSNANGLVTVQIGNGTVVSGNIAAIDWSAGPYFLKTETDPTGGTTYTITGTSQLLSVPYAFYATNVENDLDEQTLSISGQDLTISGGNTITLPAGTGGDNWGTQVVQSDATLSGDGTTGNELTVVGDLTDDQTLSLSGTDLSISGGNTIDVSSLQDGVNDADADPANEYNTGASLIGNELNITDPGGTVTVDLTPLVSGVGTQTLSFTSPNLSISGGNSVDLSALQDGVNDADADPSNEIQTISQSGNTITLSNGGGSVTVAPSADDDPTNELQTLSVSNDTIYLSNNGGNAPLPDPVLENTGGKSAICSGNTATDGTGWVQYGSTGIYIDVNTSGCGFTSTPRYFTSLGGSSAQWELVGVTSIYLATPTGFRIYVMKNNYGTITTADADANNWYINWTAVGN